MSQSIGNLIRQNYIRSALVPILVIEVMLIVLYFAINAYITDRFGELTLQESQNNLQEVIDSQANNIDLQLNEISRSLQILRDEQQEILNNPPRNISANFGLSDGGAWVKQEDNGGSAVIVSSVQALTEDIKNRVQHSEGFDRLFKSVTDHNPRIVATYFTSHYHMTRYYPYFDGIETVLPENYDINNYNFYYEANATNNPDRKVVWTGAYLDPAGQGWMISGLVPIYRGVDSEGASFEGTTGIDVTIDSLVSKILDLKLPYQSSAFILDAEGTVLAMPEKVETVLGLQELKSHDYKESIEGDVLKPEDFNLLRHHNADIRSAAKALVEGDKDRTYFQKDGQGYYLYKSPVDLTGWQLMALVPEEAIRGAVQSLEDLSQFIGYLAVAGMLLFYVLFFIYLIRNAKHTAEDLAQPVITLANNTANLGKTTKLQEVKLTGIDELDQLATRFNEMNRELTARTEQLILSEIQRRESQSKANTDYLTGLFNRRYFTETVEERWQRAISEDSSDSSSDNSHDKRENILLAIDIDHFKRINDTHGHDIGDEVLIACARVLKEAVGDQGVVARMGGEEFSVYGYMNYRDAVALADKIRKAVEAGSFTSKGLKLTVSIGLDSGKDIGFSDSFTLADKALYAAKRDGRNRVVSSSTLFHEEESHHGHCA
ncbi:sensor domain-containing diguanylate cyclase [Oceanospirillum sanctuarii]|uniref:sensor domain-containing diguanylate cyclase n=1 Tax=Oceanospirillum sanctuarii TaxID=1434821 RepID=UPI000A3AF6BE|nr:sensor domain-containing diguanylate cyclase [Oceanospirillum sanctuarii]